MQRTIHLMAALVTVASTACGRGAREEVPPPQLIEAAAEVFADETAGALLGDWALRSDPPQRPPGFSLTVTVDSVSNTGLFGRVTHFFSGNVGRDPREFEAFGDSLRPDGVVRISIPKVDPTMLGIVLEGTVSADTIRLNLFVLGPDTLSNGTRHWALVRGR